MKALSVGLIKGNIDEVDQKVQMTWVQPRVLDLQQVSGHRVWCFYRNSFSGLKQHDTLKTCGHEIETRQPPDVCFRSKV